MDLLIVSRSELSHLVVTYKCLCIKEAATGGVDILRNFAKFTGKHLCRSFFFNKVAGIKNETLAQVFSCKFYEIFKNTLFTEHLLETASGIPNDLPQ